jgi:hypothetical protein
MNGKTWAHMLDATGLSTINVQCSTDAGDFNVNMAYPHTSTTATPSTGGKRSIYI